MADQVDEIKQKIDIVSLIGEYIELKKAGRNYKALCPFHSEKTPSFMVSPELQMYKCFGCGESGDAFSFLEKYEGMEFREALKFLADRVGVTLASFRPGEESQKERLYELSGLAAKFYNYILLNHSAGKTALDYLVRERGLNLDTIKTFQIGFSPDVPDVTKKFLVDKKKFNLRELETSGIGIVKGNRVFDKFGGRIIFPLFDHRGNIAGFAGRTLPSDKSDLAKYINSPETPIYHKSRLLFGLNLTKEEIKKKGEVTVVEGEIDMISSYKAGIKNVVAIKGSALTEDQVRLIARFAKKIVLALDSDFAGDIAARRGIIVAQKEGLEIRVARLGDFKDPDEAARKNPELYKKALENAVGVWDFIIESVFSKFDSKTGQGKGEISREIVPVLAGIPDKIVQAHYIEVVAKKLDVPTLAVSDQIENEEKVGVGEKPAVIFENKNELPEKKSRKQLLEERLLSMAFQIENTIFNDPKVQKLISTPLAKRILDEYQDFLTKHKKFSSSGFASYLPKELLSGFAEMVLKDTEKLSDNPELFKKEMELIIRELEILDVRYRLQVLGAKIRQFEGAGERAKLKDSQEKFGILTNKLAKLEEANEEGIILQEG